MSYIKNIAAAILLLAVLAGLVHANGVDALPCPQSRDSSARDPTLPRYGTD